MRKGVRGSGSVRVGGYRAGRQARERALNGEEVL